MSARRLLRLALIAAIALPITACDDDVERVDLDARRRTTRGISFVEALALIERGPKRVELEVDADAPERLVRVLEIQDDVELFQYERVTGPLADIGVFTGEACRGALSLGIPGVEVRVDPNVTRFESDEVVVSCADFASRVERLTASGRPAWVVAAREPGAFPTSDGTFFAQRLRVLGGAEDEARPHLALNVGPANLRRCADAGTVTGRCVGALALLGQTFVVTAEASELGTEFPLELIVVQLDHERVRSVSSDGRELLLANGITLRVVDATRYAEPDGDEGFRTVEEARAALGAGAGLRVAGDAMVLASAPLALLADEIALVRRDAADRPSDEVIVVAGPVDTIDGATRSFRLANGTEVRVTDDTEVEGELDSFDGLVGAIEGDTPVRADVLGASTTAGSAMTVDAILVRLTRIPAVSGDTLGPR